VKDDWSSLATPLQIATGALTTHHRTARRGTQGIHELLAHESFRPCLSRMSQLGRGRRRVPGGLHGGRVPSVDDGGPNAQRRPSMAVDVDVVAVRASAGRCDQRATKARYPLDVLRLSATSIARAPAGLPLHTGREPRSSSRSAPRPGPCYSVCAVAHQSLSESATGYRHNPSWRSRWLGRTCSDVPGHP
jgi:hypothetical protein